VEVRVLLGALSKAPRSRGFRRLGAILTATETGNLSGLATRIGDPAVLLVTALDGTAARQRSHLKKGSRSRR
jgi:hypothetical protein